MGNATLDIGLIRLGTGTVEVVEQPHKVRDFSYGAQWTAKVRLVPKEGCSIGACFWWWNYRKEVSYPGQVGEWLNKVQPEEDGTITLSCFVKNGDDSPYYENETMHLRVQFCTGMIVSKGDRISAGSFVHRDEYESRGLFATERDWEIIQGGPYGS